MRLGHAHLGRRWTDDDRAGEELVSGALEDRPRLARQRRLVDRRAARRLDEHAVEDGRAADGHEDEILNLHKDRVDLVEVAIARDEQRILGLRVAERGDGATGVTAAHRLEQPAAEDEEREEDWRVELRDQRDRTVQRRT